MEELTKVLWFFKADAKGDVLDRERSLSEQIPSARQQNIQEILMRAQPGVVRKSPPEPTVADFEFARQSRHVERGLHGFQYANDRLVNDS